MTYSISEAARMLGIAPSTLRYYDKEGLLPFIGRTESGARVFRDEDFDALRLIQCLKKTGMTIRAIRAFIALPAGSEDTAARRLSILTAQRKVLCQKLDELQGMMELIDHKIAYYQPASAEHPPEG